jgi:hypothetical protein
MNSNIDYQITSIVTLRKILRRFNTLDTTVETATLLMDLRDALGYNPLITPALTARQREIITVHYIEDRTMRDAAKVLGITECTLRQVGKVGLQHILAYLQGRQSEARKLQWRPWQIALLFDAKLSVQELATKIGKSELAVKLMMSRLRKQNEAVPYRRRFSRRTPASTWSE